MSDQDVKPISSTTGSFLVLQSGIDQAVETGKTKPDSGNLVPTAKPERPDLEELAAQLNVASQSIGRDLRFRINMQSGQSVIQVLDRDTGELIREIPPEKADISLSASGDVELRLYNGRA